MPTASGLLPFLLLGLAGAGHCAGMCGGFAVLVCARGGGGRLGALGHALAYLVGKALSYALLGLLLSAGGAWLFGELDPEGLGRARQWLAAVVGVTLIAVGLQALGVSLPVPARPRAVGRLVAWGRRSFGAVRGVPGGTGSFAIGMLNGLLPCGLSWGALLLALPEPPAVAFAGLLTFGLATVPALLVTGLLGRDLFRRFAVHGSRLLGSLLILVGVLSVVRGGFADPERSPLHAHGAAAGSGDPNACCHEAEERVP